MEDVRVTSTEWSWFSVPPSNVTALLGRSAVLTCRVHPDPDVSVFEASWSKDGRPISIASAVYPRYNWTEENPTLTHIYDVLVSNVDEKDNGEWICNVDFGETIPDATAEATFSVAVPPTRIYWTTIPPSVMYDSAPKEADTEINNVDVTENGTLDVMCVVMDVNPVPTFSVYVLDPHTNETAVSLTEHEDNITSEMIPNNEPLQRVVNRVEVKNLNRTHNQMHLLCQISTEMDYPNSTLINQTYLVLNVEYPPLINITLPSEVTVEEGSELKLKCGAEGNPLPEYTWLHNGLSSQANAVLSIYSASKSDGGEYACVVMNKLGSHRSPTIQVTVVDSKSIAGLVVGLVVVIIGMLVIAVVALLFSKKRACFAKSGKGTMTPTYGGGPTETTSKSILKSSGQDQPPKKSDHRL